MGRSIKRAFLDELVGRSRIRHIGVQLPHQWSESIQNPHSKGDVEVDELQETGTQPGVEDHRPRIFLAVRSNSAFWSADRSDQTESNSTASGRHSSTNKGAGKLGLVN